MSVTHAHRAGLPVLRSISSYVHADANTPAERSGAFVTRFPGRDGLPHFDFGSASAIRVSRPAQRSLTFRPARSLSPQGTLFWKCFSPGRYLPEPLPVLPAGATEAGWVSHPQKFTALSRHTSKNSHRIRSMIGRCVSNFRFRAHFTMRPCTSKSLVQDRADDSCFRNRLVMLRNLL